MKLHVAAVHCVGVAKRYDIDHHLLIDGPFRFDVVFYMFVI
jgi:hypothetical protein